MPKESQKPDQSSEELKVQLGESGQNFQRILLDGKAIAHIKEKDMDSDRQALAAEQINEFAKTRQVIFLTCHPQTAEMLNGKCIEMAL